MRTDDEIGLLAGAFNRMSEGLAERDQVRDLLGKVVSPAVAAELLRKDVTLGGEEREVTILFSDLRSFTSMCESRSAQEMLGVLNHYFTRMSAIVEAHRGVVDKYVGDAMMALFGAPLAGPDDADRAMETALEMSEALDELNREWQAQGRQALSFGIGINTDVVVAGNMGSQTRLNYTVIGDGVNLAARLQALTKTPSTERASLFPTPRWRKQKVVTVPGDSAKLQSKGSKDRRKFMPCLAARFSAALTPSLGKGAKSVPRPSRE